MLDVDIERGSLLMGIVVVNNGVVIAACYEIILEMKKKKMKHLQLFTFLWNNMLLCSN